MKIEDFYPYVLPELPDCPDETLRQAVVRTAIDFFRHTHAWSEIADAVRLEEGVSEYDIDYPSGAIAETVGGVWCGTQELIPKTISELNDALPGWQTARSNRPVFYNATGDWGTIRLYPTPHGVSSMSPAPTLTLRGVFIPRLNATDLPNWMGDRFLDCIEAGVKGRLMMQPNQKWSQPQLGAAHHANYLELRADARITVLAERVPGVTRVRPVAFGG